MLFAFYSKAQDVAKDLRKLDENSENDLLTSEKMIRTF
jgi:hypothetical protein